MVLRSCFVISTENEIFNLVLILSDLSLYSFQFFMNEWLNEKAQEASADSPLTVKTENFEPVAPTLNSPNAASVRDRTCSLDVSFGSAKKVFNFKTMDY